MGRGNVIAQTIFAFPGEKQTRISLVELGGLYTVYCGVDPIWSHKDVGAAKAMYSWEVGKMLCSA